MERGTVTETVIEFVTEPPPPSARENGRRSKHHDIAEELQKRAFEWAMIGRYGPGMVTRITKAQSPAYEPAGAYEAVGRNYDEDRKQCDIYVRYVGSGSE